MPNILFEGTEINTTPIDADRMVFNEAGLAGAKFWTWANFKTWLGTQISGVFDFIKFTPQVTPPSEEEGVVYLNDNNKAYEFYTEVTGLQPIRAGRTLRSRVLNNTGVTIPKGKLCKIIGISGTSPIVELSDNCVLDDIKHIVGMTMKEVLDGEYGYLAVFDTVANVDTSGMTENALIYADPLVLGGFTNIEPQPPFASYPIGFVSVVDAVNGVVAIRVGGFTGSDTSINSKGILNGIVTQNPDISFSTDGITVIATVSNEESPGSDIPFIIDDKRYLLPTGDSVVVPTGIDSDTLQTSLIYAYINAGVPTLAVATTAPSIPYALISEQGLFDAPRTLADGKPFAYRRSNNSVDNKNGINDGSLGLIIRQLNATRKKLGSNWISGMDGTPAVSNTEIRLALSAGRAMQFNETSTPLFDGTSYIIFNDISDNVTYQGGINNLTSIITDAAGNTLLTNNTFYTIRLFYLFNSNGIGNEIIATRPLGSYGTASEAIRDPSNYTRNVNDTSIEEVIFPLFDLVISRIGSGGSTISLVQLTDLRSKLATNYGGGGASGGGGTDDKVRVSANDTTNDYLLAKLVGGANISLSTQNPTANETIKIDVTGLVDTYEKLVWRKTLNTVTEDVMSLDLNDNDKLQVQNAGSVSKIKFYIEDIGSNPNGVKINFVVGVNDLLAADYTLVQGWNVLTSLQNVSVSENDIIKLAVRQGSGNNDIGIAQWFTFVTT